MPEEKNSSAHEIHGHHEKEVRQVLTKMKRESEEQQAAALAASLQLPYIDLNIFPIDPETLRIIPQEEARKCEVVPIQRAGRNISLATVNITRPETQDFLKRLEKDEGYQLKIYICSKSGLEKTLEKYKHVALADSLDEIRLTLSGKDLEEFEKNLKDVIDLKKRISEIPTT